MLLEILYYWAGGSVVTGALWAVGAKLKKINDEELERVRSISVYEYPGYAPKESATEYLRKASSHRDHGDYGHICMNHSCGKVDLTKKAS